MLKTRVITALVLLSAFLSALFYLPPLGWVLFATLLAAVAAWEWGALMALAGAPRVVLGAGFTVICLGFVAFNPAALGLAPGFAEAGWRLGCWFYVPVAAFWLFVVPWWLRRRWPLPKSLLGVAVGLLLILPTWLALVQLRQAGALALIAIVLIVQMWLLSATLEAFLGGRRSVVLPAALVSIALTAICVGLGAYVRRVRS